MRFTLACALGASFAIPKRARADSSNPNLIPLGESEAFLGNAGVARASDTGAVYYNPAGLAELTSGRISASGAVYMSFSTHIDSIVRVENTDVPFDASGFNTIPATYVATRRFGSWVTALSVLVPSSLAFDDHKSLAVPDTLTNLIFSSSTSELWIGLSAAHKISDRWSFGATVFGVQHELTQILGADLVSTTTPGVFSTELAREDLNTVGLTATLGLAYTATDWLRFGLRAQSPLVQVYGKAASFQVLRTENGAGPGASGEDVQGPANYAMPFDFSLGTAISPTGWMTVLFDASLQTGANYQSFPASTFFNEDLSLQPTLRLNLGVELTPIQSVPIRLGAYYDPSTNGGQPGDPNFEKEDFYGLTAGVGFNTDHVRTTVGGFYLWSSGQMTNDDGTTAGIHSQGFGALLSTAYVF